MCEQLKGTKLVTGCELKTSQTRRAVRTVPPVKRCQEQNPKEHPWSVEVPVGISFPYGDGTGTVVHKWCALA